MVQVGSISLMDDEQRAHLQDLIDELDAHEGPRDAADEQRIQALKAELEEAMESGEHESLRDRLMEDAVGFENDHPALSAIIIRAAELLGAAGL